MATTLPTLPTLPMGEYYARVTFSLRSLAHDYDSPERVARGICRAHGLRVVAARPEGQTMAVYVLEPHANDARGWDRYRDMPCTSACRF